MKDENHKKDLKQIQREFYDGHRAEYDPSYLDLETFRNRIKSQINNAKMGITGFTLKQVKNKIILTSLGFKAGDLVLDIGCSAGNLINQLNIIHACSDKRMTFVTTHLHNQPMEQTDSL